MQMVKLIDPDEHVCISRSTLKRSLSQDTLFPADSYSLFLVYGQSAEQLKNCLRLSSHRQAAWALSLALFFSFCAFCLPFYTASIKKARIYKTDDLLWEVYIQCATRVSSARGQRTARVRKRRGRYTHAVDAMCSVGACYTTGSETTGRNKKVCVD